jgi:hypothetical protein
VRAAKEKVSDLDVGYSAIIWRNRFQQLSLGLGQRLCVQAVAVYQGRPERNLKPRKIAVSAEQTISS